MLFGGANSLVYTNFIQAVIMLIVSTHFDNFRIGYFEGGVNGLCRILLNTLDPALTQAYNPSSPLLDLV
jgi:sodium/pantothenate symporter